MSLIWFDYYWVRTSVGDQCIKPGSMKIPHGLLLCLREFCFYLFLFPSHPNLLKIFHLSQRVLFTRVLVQLSAPKFYVSRLFLSQWVNILPYDQLMVNFRRTISHIDGFSELTVITSPKPQINPSSLTALFPKYKPVINFQYHITDLWILHCLFATSEIYQ